MPLIQIVVILAVVGLLLWAVKSVIPMDPKIAQIITVVVIVAVCLWLIDLLFGFGFAGITVGHIHR
jgi:low temperature requirement protein LtrA